MYGVVFRQTVALRSDKQYLCRALSLSLFCCVSLHMRGNEPVVEVQLPQNSKFTVDRTVCASTRLRKHRNSRPSTRLPAPITRGINANRGGKVLDKTSTRRITGTMQVAERVGTTVSAADERVCATDSTAAIITIVHIFQIVDFPKRTSTHTVSSKHKRSPVSSISSQKEAWFRMLAIVRSTPGVSIDGHAAPNTEVHRATSFLECQLGF